MSKYKGLKKVPVNSDCLVASNRLHQWTTAEGRDETTGKRTVHTWCKSCGSVPA